MKPTGIDHVVLRVRDRAVAEAFYMDVIGCVLERRQDKIGMTQLRAGSSLIDLVEVDGELGRKGGAAPGEEGRNLDHFCLAIENFDLERVKAELRAKGVDLGEEGERHGASGLSVSLYLRDPDGNGLELRG
ncbi:VOC family protein [Caulobacter sp.]|uniref:VOC family protein n=1 Tax=Caulobacter sp. TaxID=78 RepID=UPI002B49EBBC|nr:VOC family protein [Caulobacter sp.]HJV40850.1 VOC family protein [Caulobacter sp.]